MLQAPRLVVQTITNSAKTFSSQMAKRLYFKDLEAKQLTLVSPPSKIAENDLQRSSNFLSNEPKKETPDTSPVQAAAGAAVKAEKVRSSRYEWEGRNNETEKSSVATNAARRSLLASAKAFLKKLFPGDRKPGSRGFFDNDDDASPSAA